MEQSVCGVQARKYNLRAHPTLSQVINVLILSVSFSTSSINARISLTIATVFFKTLSSAHLGKK